MIAVIQGDCRKVLAGMEAQSVQCVVTSPPYWGLRDYKLPPLVWGGDAECEHEWGDTRGEHHPGQVPQTKWSGNTAVSDGQTAGSGQFCGLCGAWRGSLGLEPTVELYVEHIVEVFGAVRRVLRKDGTLWLNMGDSYAAGVGMARGKPYQRHAPVKGGLWAGTKLAKRDIGNAGAVKDGTGLKPKDLIGVPWRVAFALQADGWWLRSAIVWAKGLSFCPSYSGSVMPESCRDRPTSAYEMVFLLTKSAKYFYDADAVREAHGVAHIQQQLAAPRDRGESRQFAKQGLHDYVNPAGRNLRNVWAINPQPFSDEYCLGCRTLYSGAEFGRLEKRVVANDGESFAAAAIAQSYEDGGVSQSDVPTKRVCAKCGGTDWLSHFATFPEALVEPCVKAGSSPKACGECGAPYERLTAEDAEGAEEAQRQKRACGADKDGEYHGQATKDYESAGAENPSEVKARILKGMASRVTTGWQAACACAEQGTASCLLPAARCLVLDPFCGSGTVGLECKRLGRDAILIDLSGDYCEMSRKRCAADVTQELFA